MADTRFETLVINIMSSSKVSNFTLTGNSLSERQRILNAAVNEAHKNEISFADVLSSGGQTDIDNIYRIDLASKYRNVDYIIKNLISTDSLCVARALKAHWLFTDDKYSHIINPTYINNTLQPLMSDKAFTKFLSQLTYHLKDEKRCEEFYLHYLQMKNKFYMKKFLINCSIDFIKIRIAEKDFDISPKYLSLLSCKSYEVVIVYEEVQERKKISPEHLKELRHLIDEHGDFYLNLLEANIDHYSIFCLGQRVTREVIRNHKQRIFEYPDLYLNLLNYKQLTHALSHDDIRHLASLLTSRCDFWTHDWLKKLLNLLPNKNRYNFIKSLYERHHPGEVFEMKREFATCQWYEYMSKEQREEWALQHIALRNEYLGKLYQWYKFVSFSTSFVELKKLLRAEPDARERESMFEILVSTCDDDDANITKLLKYFHDRHINEIILFKQHIIEKIMKEKNIYKCGDEVWNVLNEIFLSLRIYEDVNDCSHSFRENAVSHVLAHHIIYDKPLADKIIKLYVGWYSLLDMMMTTPWKEKVFQFMYKLTFALIDEWDLQNSERLADTIHWITELTSLLKKLECPPKPELINLIKKIRQRDSTHFNFLLYDSVFGEYFLDEDRLPKPLTEVICLQKLKKDIMLLDLCKVQFSENIQNNKMKYHKFLSKIRIYFNKDLAPEWREYFLEKFKENHKDPKGCACVVFGLTILLPASEYEILTKEYQPENAKLVWSETDPCLVHIQSNIAKFMHLVRPTINNEYLTSYAKGDFLQHSVQSIMSLSRQLPIEECHELIVKLLASPVSVQKHGIRLAFKKYTMHELVKIFGKMWTETENVSIKNLLFNYVHDLLTKAEDDVKRSDVWKLLSTLLAQLHGNEFLTNIVDPVKRKVSQVDVSVRAQYITAYWHLLQSVEGCDEIWSYRATILDEMTQDNVINLLDEDFLKHLLFTFLGKYFKQKENDPKNLPSNYVYCIWPLIAKFVIHCETKDISERRNDVFKRTLGYFFSKWGNTHGYFYQFLGLLLSNAQSVLNEDQFCNPVHLFEYIRDQISKRRPEREYYNHRLWSKFAIILINSLYEIRAFKSESLEKRCYLWGETYGKHCIELMKNETAENYPHIPQIFRHHFIKFIDNESGIPYWYEKDYFYRGVSRSLLKERADLNCCILAVECLAKGHSKPAAMDDSELNYFIDTKFPEDLFK